MHRQTYLTLAKTFGLAGAVATVADLAQPLAPIATYMMGASAIAVVILILARIIAHIWNEKMAVSTYFSAGLFVLSSVLYVFQSQSVAATEHGVIASEIPELAELQSLLGMVTKQLENIEHSVSSIDTQVANIDRSMSSVDKNVSGMTATVASIDDKLGRLQQESSTDPRKELVNIGMRWDYDNFLDALRNKDMRAIELYLQGGMKFRGENFTEFVTQIYSIPVMDMLLQANAFTVDVSCPKQISFYKNISKELQKTAFVRSMCAEHIGSLIKGLDRLIAVEQTMIDADQIYNTQLERDRESCISDLQAISAVQYVTEIESYSYKGEASIKSTVLSRLRGNGKVLKVLAYRNVNTATDAHQDREVELSNYYQTLDQDIAKIIHEECLRSYSEINRKVINIDKLGRLRSERMVLSNYQVAKGAD